jgi:acyl carrier protein phosphodiesterase
MLRSRARWPCTEASTRTPTLITSRQPPPRQPARRRFAGILVDMFYDHFLARHWDEYNDMPWNASPPASIGAARAPRRRPSACRISRRAWLRPTGWFVPSRGGRRLRARSHWPAAQARQRAAAFIRGMLKNYDAFEADFHTFFPEVVRFARRRQPASDRTKSFPCVLHVPLNAYERAIDSPARRTRRLRPSCGTNRTVTCWSAAAALDRVIVTGS